MKNRFATAFGSLILLAGLTAHSQPVNVPNSNFALPLTDYVTPYICAWEETLQPPGSWDTLVGVFYNSPDYQADGSYIYNCTGTQAAFLFAYPGTGFFQDYDSIGGTNTAPTYAFDATYNVGEAYALQAGFIGSTNFYGLEPGSTVEMSLYYRDGSGDMVTVASTNIVYDTNVFTTITEFVNFPLITPAVQATDPWAGQNIGIEFVSTVSTNLMGGYWDIGNVQLTAYPTPALINPILGSNGFSATLLGAPGQSYEILATTNAAAPEPKWPPVFLVFNQTGVTTFTDPSTNFTARYYGAKKFREIVAVKPAP